jgi:hypothetical protein
MSEGIFARVRGQPEPLPPLDENDPWSAVERLFGFVFERLDADPMACVSQGPVGLEVGDDVGPLEARGATGIIFGTSGYDVERELRAYAEVAGLR